MHDGVLYQVALLSGRTYVTTGPIGVICNYSTLEDVLRVLVQPEIGYLLERLYTVEIDMLKRKVAYYALTAYAYSERKDFFKWLKGFLSVFGHRTQQ